MQLKARLLAPVHDVAACAARIETAREASPPSYSASGTPQRLLREREPQQQRVDALLLLHQRNDVGGALLLEQPVAVRADRVEVARIGGERGAEMRLGGRVAAPLRDLAEQRLDPRIDVGRRIRERREPAFESSLPPPSPYR